MTADNPEGWKLEELLEQIVSEVHAKTEKIAHVDAPAAKLYVDTNWTIAAQLLALAEAQRQAVAYAKENPFTI